MGAALLVHFLTTYWAEPFPGSAGVSPARERPGWPHSQGLPKLFCGVALGAFHQKTAGASSCPRRARVVQFSAYHLFPPFGKGGWENCFLRQHKDLAHEQA
jgi:hypothetical protein